MSVRQVGGNASVRDHAIVFLHFSLLKVL
jgi:hypothetical protein